MYSKRALALAISVFAAFAAVANAAETSKINIPDNFAGQTTIDDGQPDVTARVARISYLKGDAQVLRAGSTEWEDAAPNLPLVEGDELTTSAGARLEIQFDSYTYLRMDESSNLKIVTLRDEGIALSLPQGTIGFRLNEFDINKAYFEVDAPGSTVAAQLSGAYRIDAGQPGDNEIRVNVADSGEARIYSKDLGFLLKDGRSARIVINGANSGESNISGSDLYADNFGEWMLERDDAVSRLVQTADYGKYYDRDIYGAEDLNNNGEWIYTRDYGYVWRPYSSATSAYTAWSPYRYGQWRWIPPYGWTWINDEPWGWATYHYGRWFYDNGYWYWSPYGAYRYSRSWWSPALVVITGYGGSICWYPLPYGYSYYNYNYYYYNSSGWPGHHHGGNNGGSGGGTGPTPTPTPTVVAGGPLTRPRGPRTPPLGTVPPTGVVTVPAGEFGIRGARTGRPPLSVANTVLSTVPTDRPTQPILPVTPRGTDRAVPGTNRTGTNTIENTRRTGAATRKADAPLDQELRKTRILGGRPPVPTNRDNTAPVSPDSKTTRPTGAVERTPPIVVVPETRREPAPRPPLETTRKPENQTPPYVPPRQEPKQETPIVRQPPRYDPPPRQEPPTNRQPPPRVEPPTTKPAPPKQEPPATKPDVKTDKKPA